ncbi:MAG: hypothetical protein WC905_02850 [Patescibacteria group bacterium]
MFPASLRSWDNSTCASIFAMLALSECHYVCRVTGRDGDRPISSGKL